MATPGMGLGHSAGTRVSTEAGRWRLRWGGGGAEELAAGSGSKSRPNSISATMNRAKEEPLANQGTFERRREKSLLQLLR
jgi:hypothetical protein